MLDSADFYTYDPKKFPFQSTLNEKQHTPNVQHARGETYFGYHISCSEAMDGIPPYENQKIFLRGACQTWKVVHSSPHYPLQSVKKW